MRISRVRNTGKANTTMLYLSDEEADQFCKELGITNRAYARLDITLRITTDSKQYYCVEPYKGGQRDGGSAVVKAPPGTPGWTVSQTLPTARQETTPLFGLHEPKWEYRRFGLIKVLCVYPKFDVPPKIINRESKSAPVTQPALPLERPEPQPEPEQEVIGKIAMPEGVPPLVMMATKPVLREEPANPDHSVAHARACIRYLNEHREPLGLVFTVDGNGDIKASRRVVRLEELD